MPIKLTPENIKIELCKKDFFFFVKEFWSVIIPEEPVYNWHIEYLCRQCQILAFQVKKRLPKLYDLIINVPPGSTKSTICTIMFPVWCWTIDPTLRFITASYSSPLSIEHSVKSRDIIRSDKFRRFFPDIEMKRDRDNKMSYENLDTGSRTTTSVGGTITGKHAHVIIVDDPINPQEAYSDHQRNEANKWLDSTLSSRKVDKKVTPTILIMQRLHEKDCTGHILSKTGKNIRHICLPAEKTDDIKPKQLRRFYKDGLLDQDRLSQDVLDEAKLDLGTSGYNGQYGQSPKDPIGGMFQKHWFQYTDIIPSTGKKVRYWDLAATEKKDNNKPCWTVGLLMMKASDKKYYICDIVRLQGNPTKVENTIKLTAAMDGPSVDIWMEQEPGASAINTIDYYRRVVLPGYVFRPDKVGKSKVERARPLSVQAEAGNVVLLRGAKWCNAFLDEASFFPLSENMDQVDTASGAFNKLVMGGGFRATRI